MTRFFLTTLGCRLNEAEIARWSRELHAQGHSVVAQPEVAHVIVLNTCAVTGEAARKSRQLARKLHRQNPTARLVLTGCYAQLEPADVAAIAGVDHVIGNQAKAEMVSALVDIEPGMPALATEPDANVFGSTHTRGFIKVQDGCRNKCAFCIVTVARGAERSRTIEDVVTEVRALQVEGYNEVVLTGVHLGGYGHDLGGNLRQLIEAVLEQTDIPRLRLGSLEPWDLPEGFFELWQDPRLCPHLHLPLQSGSDSVLKRMARRCFTGSYARLVETARHQIPEFSVTTDLIVGFPGETDDEFRQTLSFIDDMHFAHMHIFQYSPRKGTRAATLPGQIPGDVKRQRSQETHRAASRMRANWLLRCVGQTRPVLWERRSKIVDQGRLWTGYTDHYVRVETTTAAHVDMVNRITNAQLVRVVDGERLVAEHSSASGFAPAHPA